MQTDALYPDGDVHHVELVRAALAQVSALLHPNAWPDEYRTGVAE